MNHPRKVTQGLSKEREQRAQQVSQAPKTTQASQATQAPKTSQDSSQVDLVVPASLRASRISQTTPTSSQDAVVKKASTSKNSATIAKVTTKIVETKIVTTKIVKSKIATPKIVKSKIATPKIVESKIAAPKIATPKIIASIYVDGSHIKGTSKLGFGAWGTITVEGAATPQPVAPHNSPVAGGNFVLSGSEQSEVFKKIAKKFPGEKFSNPTMELFGLFMTVAGFIRIPNAHITIHQDYSGAVNFGYLWSISSGKPRAKKAWEAKIPYIKFLVENIEFVCKTIEDNGGSVAIKWVPGHSGDAGNDKADSLAKCREDYFFSSLCVEQK